MKDTLEVFERLEKEVTELKNYITENKQKLEYRDWRKYFILFTTLELKLKKEVIDYQKSIEYIEEVDKRIKKFNL